MSYLKCMNFNARKLEIKTISKYIQTFPTIIWMLNDCSESIVCTNLADIHC